MADGSEIYASGNAAPNRVRLQTLSRLRWIAIAGQTAALLLIYFVFGFELPLGFCLALVALSAWLNLFLRLRYTASHRLTAPAAAALLAYDVMQLAALLYLTGGLSNPFSLLFIVPVAVSASNLPPRMTIILGLLALVSAGLIGLTHWPLPWHSDQVVDLPQLYTFGIWAGLASCIAFVGIYAWRISAESIALSNALSATELALMREHHLAALDGLAAAAAHELGTPLATIHLVASELSKDSSDPEQLKDDIELIRSQSQRCREILAKLGSMGSDDGDPYERTALTGLVEDIADPHRGFGIDLKIMPEGTGPEPKLWRDPAILYGLGNIVENAIDYAETTVRIAVIWDTEKIAVEIADDGPGFPHSILNMLGEPYIHRAPTQAQSSLEERKGLGLGVFIAKTLLERTGAKIEFANGKAGGARVRAEWPRSRLVSTAD